MCCEKFQYVIVGAGLAGVSAAKAIRGLDSKGSILLVGREFRLPYHRPPLSKDLWFGDNQVEETLIESLSFYKDNHIQMRLGTSIDRIDPDRKTVTDRELRVVGFEKLLLATGGTPRRLAIPGGDGPGVCYYRDLDDYVRMSRSITPNTRALVIGGGFIGSEMAAAISSKAKQVSILFPEPYLGAAVFPLSLATAIGRQYQARGIALLSGDRPASIEDRGNVFTTVTEHGNHLHAEVVLAGIGIRPEVEVAQKAGLEIDGGIVVNERLETSHPDIYAAGDNVQFFYPTLGQRRRVAHWACALGQGTQAGRNMAGSAEPYTSLPYFFSDLFDFGYEAVGDTDPNLDIRMVWETPNEKGIIYYLRDQRVRGVMMCNVWNRVDEARALIESGRQMRPDDLEKAIRW